MQLTQLIELVRGNLDSVRRKIIVALVTTDVHARDIVENLVKEQISSVQDFLWQQ
jgi:dynein heavy chain, axonemal